MGGYNLLHDRAWSLDDYAIESIRLEDAEPVRIWRNQQIDVLRQSQSLTVDQQKEYFKKEVLPEFELPHPNQILVRFTLDGKLIGYGGIVHINWADQRGEVSFLLDTKRAQDTETYRKEIAIFLRLILDLAFNELCPNKLCTESYAHRTYHVDAIEESGFVREGLLRKHTFIDGRWYDAVVASALREEYLSCENAWSPTPFFLAFRKI